MPPTGFEAYADANVSATADVLVCLRRAPGSMGCALSPSAGLRSMKLRDGTDSLGITQGIRTIGPGG